MRLRTALSALAALLALCGAALGQGLTGNFAVPANALSTTAVTIKGSQGVLAAVNCANPNASVTYVQFFDTVGSVTPGTTVPKFSLALPASGAFSFGIEANFVTGIKAIAATTPTGGSAPGSAVNCTFTFR